MSHQPNNVFAGTQVVPLFEVRGTNNALVHPRGAVGVVTRTPTDDQDQFLVRFPDGFEASLMHEQLDVLKHFKNRVLDQGGSNHLSAVVFLDYSPGSTRPRMCLTPYSQRRRIAFGKGSARRTGRCHKSATC